jgi:hypothetical protein
MHVFIYLFIEQNGMHVCTSYRSEGDGLGAMEVGHKGGMGRASQHDDTEQRKIIAVDSV